MATSPPRYTRCPKCGQQPLPDDQSLPAACPHCGVILAKVGQVATRAAPTPAADKKAVLPEDQPGWTTLLTHTPKRVDSLQFWCRVALLAALAMWSWVLIGLDYRTGEMNESFLHRPLLVFHEAGHVLFMPLGHWLMVLGGTLGQLLMPAVLAGALLICTVTALAACAAATAAPASSMTAPQVLVVQ